MVSLMKFTVRPVPSTSRPFPVVDRGARLGTAKVCGSTASSRKRILPAQKREKLNPSQSASMVYAIAVCFYCLVGIAIDVSSPDGFYVAPDVCVRGLQRRSIKLGELQPEGVAESQVSNDANWKVIDELNEPLSLKKTTTRIHPPEGTSRKAQNCNDNGNIIKPGPRENGNIIKPAKISAELAELPQSKSQTSRKKGVGSPDGVGTRPLKILLGRDNIGIDYDPEAHCIRIDHEAPEGKHLVEKGHHLKEKESDVAGLSWKGMPHKLPGDMELVRNPHVQVDSRIDGTNGPILLTRSSLPLQVAESGPRKKSASVDEIFDQLKQLRLEIGNTIKEDRRYWRNLTAIHQSIIYIKRVKDTSRLI